MINGTDRFNFDLSNEDRNEIVMAAYNKQLDVIAKLCEDSRKLNFLKTTITASTGLYRTCEMEPGESEDEWECEHKHTEIEYDSEDELNSTRVKYYYEEVVKYSQFAIAMTAALRQIGLPDELIEIILKQSNPVVRANANETDAGHMIYAQFLNELKQGQNPNLHQIKQQRKTLLNSFNMQNPNAENDENHEPNNMEVNNRARPR